ncbi:MULTISPECIES: hypothetical protein [Mycobacterium]|nr:MULTISPECIES: hypothetical protein [Mycobacterium]MBI2697998.1 hypothetical protein [Mycobacterium sp.]MBX9980687.1 hypothetical protein [Mycobacterium gordonae]MCQ4360787.1 hypothetical protein [Mycobacterium gordonae]MCV7005814.1 hypothetical protein [Mycobacterium gordonae]
MVDIKVKPSSSQLRGNAMSHEELFDECEASYVLCTISFGTSNMPD